MNQINTKMEALANKNWEIIKDNSSAIAKFLANHQHSSFIAEMTAISANLIVTELVFNGIKYSIYPSINNDNDYFIETVIKILNFSVPDINDKEANELYIDNIRSIIWGHMKSRFNILSEILISFDIEGKKNPLSQEDCDILLECLTVAWIEAILRRKEIMILENSYA